MKGFFNWFCFVAVLVDQVLLFPYRKSQCNIKSGTVELKDLIVFKKNMSNSTGEARRRMMPQCRAAGAVFEQELMP